MEMESVFDALADDVSGYKLKEIHEELFEMRQDIKRAMDRGMTQEEMAVARLAVEAVNHAEHVTGRIYEALSR